VKYNSNKLNKMNLTSNLKPKHNSTFKDVNIDNFETNLDKYDTAKSAGMSYYVEFITDTGKASDDELVTYLNTNIERLKSIGKLNLLIKNVNISILVEAGIYEFSLVYITRNNILPELLITVYADTLNEIILNLDVTSSVENHTLLNKLSLGKIFPQHLAFMTPQEIHPKRWKDNIRKKKIKEYKKNNMAATDMYKCYKCGERKCTVKQLQTRSSDEPLTTFVTCLVCHNTFKM
jgi:hypothetical protein